MLTQSMTVPPFEICWCLAFSDSLLSKLVCNGECKVTTNGGKVLDVNLLNFVEING